MNRSTRQESGRGRSNPDAENRAMVTGRTTSLATPTITQSTVTKRTFHSLAQIVTGISTASPFTIALSYTPTVSIINTYDRYVVKRIKAHLIPASTTVMGAVAVAYDPTSITAIYTNTVQLLSVNNAMVAEVSPAAPRIITYTIDRPGNLASDQLYYNPVGTGTPWDAGTLLLGSLNVAENFSVWLEYEVELISPRSF